MSNRNNTETKRRLIEDVAQLLMPWGVPRSAAMLYGYLLFSANPVSLDRIAADLELGKSTASVAARLLEKYLLARRRTERGSKRVLYEASDNYEGILIEQNQLLDRLAELLHAGAEIATPGPARNRLEQMAKFYSVIREGMESAFDRWRAQSTVQPPANRSKRSRSRMSVRGERNHA